jgi:hypothetical protein
MLIAQADQLYLGSSRCARPLPRGVTGHVAHPSRFIVSRQLPLRSTATLTALPAMSLAPVAPFAEASAAGRSSFGRDLPSSDYSEILRPPRRVN